MAGFIDECRVAGVTDMRFSYSNGVVWYADGYPTDQRAVVDGVLASYDPAAGPTLEEVQRAASGSIDAHAEALRLTVLTPGTGQMAAYQRKETQARAYLEALVVGAVPADAVEAAATWPAIYGEVGITAETPVEVAQVVVANANAWYAYGDAIERARLGGKRAIMDATDAAGVTDAVEAIVWPSATASGGS